MTERERNIQKSMMTIIKKYGGYVYKNAQNMYTEKGRPDVSACVPVKISDLAEIFGADNEIGIFIGIEVKRDKSTYDATEAQEIVGRKIKAAKGLWFALDDPGVVEALMLKLGRTSK